MGEIATLERPIAAAYEADEIARLDAMLLPAAVRVQDLYLEQETQAAFAQGLGALAVGEAVQDPDGAAESVLDDMDKAAQGDFRALVRNAHLALYEGMLSQGVAEVEVTRDEQGRLSQYGRTIYDVLESAIVHHPGDHPALHEVTRQEALGLYSWDALDAAGYFEDHILVIPRLAPATAPARVLREYGYFENLAVAWGIVWKTGDTFTMRSLFTSGTTVEDNEEATDEVMTDEQLDQMFASRLARRHDITAVQRMYEGWGLAASEKLIDYHRGALIPKEWFEHIDDPSADIARFYDNQLGPDYFLGDKGPRQEYVAHGRTCLETMRSLEPQAQALSREFMQAYHGKVSDPMHAARLLAKMGRRKVIDYVIDHPEIDARTLGTAAVQERELYYQAVAAGNASAALALRESIQQKARVNMCGFGGINRDKEKNDTNPDEYEKDGSDLADARNESSRLRDKYGSLTFKCPKGHKNKRPYGRLINRCRHCGASVKC